MPWQTSQARHCLPDRRPMRSVATDAEVASRHVSDSPESVLLKWVMGRSTRSPSTVMSTASL